LFKERFKALIRGGSGNPPPVPARRASTAASSPAGTPRRIANRQPESYPRASRGLEQFFLVIGDTPGLSILDFSAASQANITFITNLGHRIYAEDFLDCLDSTFPEDDFFEPQSHPVKAQQVLDQCLDFPPEHFDGALVWDLLQYVAPPLLTEVADRLYEVLRPNAYVLAYFSSEERAPLVQNHVYRIADAKTLLLTPRCQRPPSQHFTTRSLEKLFARYQQVKFFLTRDNIREVLVRR
jgi:hypothetical protein